jgi:hypothetical protein
MALKTKITTTKKLEYAERTKDFKEKIKELENQLNAILKDISKGGELVNYKKIAAANLYLNLIALNIKLSDISLEVLGIKNEAYLENARKLYYKLLAILEEIVGTHIDAPLTENKEALETISKLDDLKRLKLIKNISEALTSIEERFGPDSKWKWSFVDLEARAAVLCKNLIDFKLIQEKNDPRIEGYPERNETMRFIKSYLRRAADRVREKYEIATHDFGEMKKAIQILEVLARISTVFSTTQEEIDNLRKTIKTWQEKLEQDEKLEEERKKEKLKKK